MNKTFLKLAVGLIAVFAVVNVAGANTVADLQAMIAQLQAQIASLQGVATTPAVSATITSDLTIGSKGAQVDALQQMLIDGGYLKIAAPTGYFGSLTKAAVQAWQRDNGVSATGYFGPISRSKLVTIIVPPVVVPPTTPTTPTTPALDNTDGSITAADAAFVSTGATFKKGDAQNIYDVRLSATGGKVAVTRLDVKFSERPWLTLSKLTLKDTSGNVIAEKALSSSADATEVTVGSDYRVRFDNFNYVVTPGTDAVLVVSAVSMSSSDKITTQTVTVSIPTGGIRTVNGKGYSESLGGITAKTFVFSSTGSVADLNTSVSPNTPDKRNVTTTTSVTPDVVLGVYRLKSVNADAYISSLAFMLKSSTGVATSTLLTNLRLVAADGTTYGAASLTAGPTFANMNIKLPKDSWQDITLKADINASQSLTASTTLDASTVVGIDANYNTLTLTNASDVTANDVIFSTGALELASSSIVPGDAVLDGNGAATNKNVDFVFTLKNNSNSVLFASTTLAQLLATSTVGSAGGATVASSTMQSLSANPSTNANDTATNYAIQPGSSRTFTVKGLVSKIGGSTSYSELKITGINYSGTTVASGTINFGLEALKYGLSL